jgi:hypothetical protein
MANIICEHTNKAVAAIRRVMTDKQAISKVGKIMEELFKDLSTTNSKMPLLNSVKAMYICKVFEQLNHTLWIRLAKMIAGYQPPEVRERTLSGLLTKLQPGSDIVRANLYLAWNCRGSIRPNSKGLQLHHLVFESYLRAQKVEEELVGRMSDDDEKLMFNWYQQMLKADDIRRAQIVQEALDWMPVNMVIEGSKLNNQEICKFKLRMKWAKLLTHIGSTYRVMGSSTAPLELAIARLEFIIPQAITDLHSRKLEPMGLVEVCVNLCGKSLELKKTALGLLEADGDHTIVSVLRTRWGALGAGDERAVPKYWLGGHPCPEKDEAGWHSILEENGGYTHHLLDNEAKLKRFKRSMSCVEEVVIISKFNTYNVQQMKSASVHVLLDTKEHEIFFFNEAAVSSGLVLPFSMALSTLERESAPRILVFDIQASFTALWKTTQLGKYAPVNVVDIRLFAEKMAGDCSLASILDVGLRGKPGRCSRFQILGDTGKALGETKSVSIKRQAACGDSESIVDSNRRIFMEDVEAIRHLKMQVVHLHRAYAHWKEHIAGQTMIQNMGPQKVFDDTKILSLKLLGSTIAKADQ